jgi:hypothetical protein
LCQPRWHNGQAALGETPRRGSRHPVAAGPSLVHELRSLPQCEVGP